MIKRTKKTEVCICGAPSHNGVCSVPGCVASKEQADKFAWLSAQADKGIMVDLAEDVVRK